jgi:hypothetical protein
MLWRNLWPLGLRHIFRHYLINGAIFGKKLLSIKCVFWFSLQFCLKRFSFQEELGDTASKMSKRLYVKYLLLLSDFNETWIFSTHFRKKKKRSSNIKFHQNPSSGSRVVPGGQTDMTKLIVAFRNFANAPKNVCMVELFQHFPSISKSLKQRFWWFKYDRDWLCVNKSHIVPVIFEPPCISRCYENFSEPL